MAANFSVSFSVVQGNNDFISWITTSLWQGGS